jgi:hypothetical protein
MSALGQKRTLRLVRLMSALPLKADIAQHGGNVRLVPQADIQQLPTPVGGPAAFPTLKMFLTEGPAEEVGSAQLRAA